MNHDEAEHLMHYGVKGMKWGVRKKIHNARYGPNDARRKMTPKEIKEARKTQDARNKAAVRQMKNTRGEERITPRFGDEVDATTAYSTKFVLTKSRMDQGMSMKKAKRLAMAELRGEGVGAVALGAAGFAASVVATQGMDPKVRAGALVASAILSQNTVKKGVNNLYVANHIKKKW